MLQVQLAKQIREYHELHFSKARYNVGDVQKRLCSVDGQRSEQEGVGNISTRSILERVKRTKSLSLKRLFIGLLIMGSLPGIHPSELSTTICKYFHYKDRCEYDLEQSLKKTNITEGSHCLGSFTRNICWPHTPAGITAEVPCPDFFGGANETLSALKFCTKDGTWLSFPDRLSGKEIEWASIDDCIVSENISESDQNTDSGLLDFMENLRIMYTVGYSASLACLGVALLLLSCFKKLHCTRNYIHMNLMVSFILRYAVVLVKDSVLDSHYNIDGVNGPDMDIDSLRRFCDDDDTTGWLLTGCRLVITLMLYAVTANYFWLLAEGLYLQMLLVSVMSENKYLSRYMVLGWGAPWISVLVWVVLRMHFENNGCWDMNMDMNIWWTIRAPIMTSILINFCLFINIVRTVSKLRASNTTRKDRKLRLAKTFFVLIPLLGIHYIVFLFLLDEMTSDSDPALHLKLAFELFFSSIQGAMIALFYCFLDNNVRAAVSSAWNQWRQRAANPHYRNRQPLEAPTILSSCGHELLSLSEMPLVVDLARPQSCHSNDSEIDSADRSVSPATANGDHALVNMIENGTGQTVN